MRTTVLAAALAATATLASGVPSLARDARSIVSYHAVQGASTSPETGVTTAQLWRPAGAYNLRIYPGVSIGPIILRVTTLHLARRALGPETVCRPIGQHTTTCEFPLPPDIHRTSPDLTGMPPTIDVSLSERSGLAEVVSTNSIAFTLRDTPVTLGMHVRAWTAVLGLPEDIIPFDPNTALGITFHMWPSKGIDLFVTRHGIAVAVMVYIPR